MIDQKVLLIAAAVGVVFLPQIAAFAKGLLDKAKAQSPVPSSVNSRAVGSDRADWVADMLALQKVLDANGQIEAASLIAQAAVRVIGAPNAGGAKK
jgi:carboxylesterase type B